MLFIVTQGSPCFNGSIEKIIEVACIEGGVIVENMHDIPYLKHNEIGPETTAAMTRICSAVKQVLPTSVSCGVQILAGCNKESLAVAQSAGFNFIRAEGFIYGHVADEGYIDSCCGSLLRYRHNLKCDDILIFTDIKKKHSSHAVTNDVSIEEMAESAEFFKSDGIIVTGSATGKKADVMDFECVKRTVNIPVIIGSGVTKENLSDYMGADAIIIGSHFKHNGRWQNMVDEDRLLRFLHTYNSLKHT